MAEGYARATGQPGVALVISGPGVTNAMTALAQCYADSLPMLLISAEPPSHTIGKGWGFLHDISEQRAVSAPVTAMSATAMSAADVPVLLARAFSIFRSERPRPVHLSIPIDVQEELVGDVWPVAASSERPIPAPDAIEEAVVRLLGAKHPTIMVGGGALAAAVPVRQLAEHLGAAVVTSTAAKGLIGDAHPLAVSGGTVRPEVHAFLRRADCVLAVGTELSDTDSFCEPLRLNGAIIRVDIDARKMNDQYPAAVPLVADAEPTCQTLLEALAGRTFEERRAQRERDVQALRASMRARNSEGESRHIRLLDALRECTPPDTIFAGDACQLVYTGAYALQLPAPRRWFYPVGYCALGNALPNAIGAGCARPDQPVVALAGDGGVMFTIQELMVAVELRLPIAIIIWDNAGLKQIRDDMALRDVPAIGVDGINPDFVALARACGADAVCPTSMPAFQQHVRSTLAGNVPRVLVVNEQAGWLGG